MDLPDSTVVRDKRQIAKVQLKKHPNSKLMALFLKREAVRPAEPTTNLGVEASGSMTAQIVEPTDELENKSNEAKVDVKNRSY